MELIKFILWLATGAVIGWFAGRMAKAEKKRTDKPLPGEDRSAEKS